MRERPLEGFFCDFWNPRWPPNGLYSKKRSVLCFSVYLLFINLEMAGPIGLKLGWMIEGICRNNLAGDFVGFLESKMAAKWII